MTRQLRLPRPRCSETTKQKLRLLNLGRKHTPETIAKLREIMKRPRPNSKGWVKLTPEEKAARARERVRKERLQNQKDDLFLARHYGLWEMVKDIEASAGHWARRRLHYPGLSDGYHRTKGVMRTPNPKAKPYAV